MKNTIKKGIYLNDKKIGIITHREGDRGSSKIIQVVQKNYPFLRCFFGFEIAPIKIHLLYSRDAINKVWGAKTPIWMCGFVKGRNKIYVLSPLICRKVSQHTENAIYKVVIHELVHLFIKKMNKSPLGWLNEGLSLFLAKQIKDKSIKRADWKFLMKCGFITNPELKWTKIGNRSGYKASYLLVIFLMKQYGKNKLMKLLNINANKRNPAKKLEQVFKISLEELIKNFQKTLKFI